MKSPKRFQMVCQHFYLVCHTSFLLFSSTPFALCLHSVDSDPGHTNENWGERLIPTYRTYSGKWIIRWIVCVFIFFSINVILVFIYFWGGGDNKLASNNFQVKIIVLLFIGGSKYYKAYTGMLCFANINVFKSVVEDGCYHIYGSQKPPGQSHSKGGLFRK